jgi:hypothetical protein
MPHLCLAASQIWDAETGAVLLNLWDQAAVSALAVFPDPTTGTPHIATGGADNWKTFDQNHSERLALRSRLS